MFDYDLAENFVNDETCPTDEVERTLLAIAQAWLKFACVSCGGPPPGVGAKKLEYPALRRNRRYSELAHMAADVLSRGLDPEDYVAFCFDRFFKYDIDSYIKKHKVITSKRLGIHFYEVEEPHKLLGVTFPRIDYLLDNSHGWYLEWVSNPDWVPFREFISDKKEKAKKAAQRVDMEEVYGEGSLRERFLRYLSWASDNRHLESGGSWVAMVEDDSSSPLYGERKICFEDEGIPLEGTILGDRVRETFEEASEAGMNTSSTEFLSWVSFRVKEEDLRTCLDRGDEDAKEFTSGGKKVNEWCIRDNDPICQKFNNDIYREE